MITLNSAGCSLLAIMFATAAAAQEAPRSSPDDNGATAADQLQEIIVTANKREQSLRDVPLSISAASGETLQDRRVTDTSDLAKIAPGFVYTESAFATPVYTVRGVGFYDTSLAAKPSVSVYVDEVPLPFSIITRGAVLDLERVEVLKGPQGTLFGQNATGGAINYIAAKPTSDLKAGINLGYERFDRFTAEGYLSGPISDTLTARLAVRTDQGGAWQRSLTRPDDELGDRNFAAGRLTFDFEPDPDIKFQLTMSGYLDKSDEVAAQYIAFTPSTPPRGANIDAALRALGNARDADWTPDPKPGRDHSFYQVALRSTFNVTQDLTLTSITAYSDYDHKQNLDPDGVALNSYFYRTTGRMRSFSQELRLTGSVGNRLQYILGGNYSRERTRQRDDASIRDGTAAYQISDAFAATGFAGFPPFFGFADQGVQTFTSKAAFANVDYELGDAFVLHGGVRYTDNDTKFSGCSLDDGNGILALGYQVILNNVRAAFGRPPTTVPAGGCLSINPATLESGLATGKLSEDNVSWRAGVDYKPSSDLLIYASASRGYKSGSFPILAASDVAQFAPVTQESVTAYEVGVKATVLERRLQIAAAAFYYDYRDKQLKGRSISSPDIFGPLERLFNVPKSSIKGAEIQLDIRPTKGFLVSIGGTYLDTKVHGSFLNFDTYGQPRDFGGSPFPYTPKYQIVIDGQYDWQVGSVSEMFVGAGLQFQSDTTSTLGPQRSYPYPELNRLGGLGIKDYAIVGARAGFKSIDNRYRISIFADNIFNQYYWTNATRITDTTVRFAGRPATYGINLSFNY